MRRNLMVCVAHKEKGKQAPAFHATADVLRGHQRAMKQIRFSSSPGKSPDFTLKVFPLIIYHGITGKFISYDSWHIKQQPRIYNGKKSWMKNNRPRYNQLIEIKIKNITESKMRDAILKVHICVCMWRKRRDATISHCDFLTPLFSEIFFDCFKLHETLLLGLKVLIELYLLEAINFPNCLG